MAADYKNSSITLGKFETGAQPQGLEQGMERMSIQQPSGRISQGLGSAMVCAHLV
jgi:bud emergence protein 1